MPVTVYVPGGGYINAYLSILYLRCQDQHDADGGLQEETLAFNSLFEMLAKWRAEYLAKYAIVLSILYLRCVIYHKPQPPRR